MLRSGSGRACFAEGQVQPGVEQGISHGACIVSLRLDAALNSYQVKQNGR